MDSFGGGKDQDASQLAVVASLPLAPWSFSRSEITGSVQGVATRCLIARPAGDDALPRGPDFLRNFRGPKPARSDLKESGCCPWHDEKSLVRAMRRTFYYSL